MEGLDLKHLLNENDRLHKLVGEKRDRILVLEKKINTLFDAIKHGDEPHQRWLKDKIRSHFDLK